MVSDPYKTLNLPHSANETDIKRSYRQLSRKYHPDTWSQPCFSELEKEQATAKFTEISAAYTLLTDEKRKAEYDRLYKYGGGHDEEPDSSSRETKRQGSAPPPPRTTADAPPPLPNGWTSAMDPSTGCVYYYNEQTGQSSWRHPAVQSEKKENGLLPDNNKLFGRRRRTLHPADYSTLQEDPSHATRRPDNHQCDAFCSLCLFLPIGLIAMYHSVSVDRCWRQGLYGEAVNHARQAPKYACLGNVVGIAFWIYWIFFREGSEFEWPDFDFDFNK